MIAALATLAFLAAFWLVIVALAGAFSESGGKVVAALRGQSLAAQPMMRAVPVRVSARYPAARSQRARARPELRAAA